MKNLQILSVPKSAIFSTSVNSFSGTVENIGNFLYLRICNNDVDLIANKLKENNIIYTFVDFPAHVSIIYPMEISDKILSFNKYNKKIFTFSLGDLYKVRVVKNKKVYWVVRAESKQLEKIRLQYGLPPYPVYLDEGLFFHVTVLKSNFNANLS